MYIHRVRVSYTYSIVQQTPWLVIIPSLSFSVYCSCSFYLFVCPNLNGHWTGYKYVEYIFIHKQQQEQQLHLLWSPFTCLRPIPSLIPWSTHILDPASVVASCPVPVYGNKLSALSLWLVSCPVQGHSIKLTRKLLPFYDGFGNYW